MPRGFFDNRIRWDFERNGTQRKLPYFYYDNTLLAAIFLASSSKIEQLLPHPSMKPVEIIPGRCTVAFAAFEYRETDFEPYNEVSISFLISFGQRQIPGFTAAKMMLSRTISSYVWQLPVNTEHARAGGVNLFGYPKFLADISFDKGDEWITCTLAEEGREILQLRGRRLPTKKAKLIHYITYAVENGSPLVAEVLVNPVEYAESYGGSEVELELGSGHYVSDMLEQVDLGKQALVYQYSPTNEAILFPARNVFRTTLE
ncbi:MAG: acetoacetate decarboxylase family protein [Deltaproteobacteria bacterium]